MKGRKLWCRVQANGGTIPVYVSKDVQVDGADCDAYYEHDSPCIVIRQNDNVNAMKAALHHELLHVCFAGHSGDVKAKVLGARTPEGRARREEAIVGFLEPVQFQLLVSNGFLKYPKPPRLP